MLEEYDDSAADTVPMDGSASEFYFTFEEITGGKMISYQEYGYPHRKDITKTWEKIREIQKKNAEPSE